MVNQQDTLIPIQQMVEKITGRNFRLIGQGGIGGIVTPTLARFLHTLAAGNTLYLIDGDEYELRNRERMAFTSFGNKAVDNAQRLAKELG